MAVLLVAGLFLLVQSSGTNPEADAVVATMRGFEEAVAKHDLERMRTLSTERFYRDYLKLSGSAGIFAEDNPELAIGRAMTRKVDSVTIQGSNAQIAATVTGANAPNVDAIEVRAVKEHGRWLLDALAMRKKGNTGGAQVVDVTMRDFSFAPDPLVIRADTPLVLRARNIGAQPHMIGIWSVPPDANLIKTIEATESVPAGVQRFVQSSTFVPGDEGDITVARGLKPGRYMLTCFLSDITSDVLTPHYDLGMLTEFTVK